MEHRLEKLVKNLERRDQDLVRRIDQYSAYSGYMSLEQRLEIADARASDALMAVAVLAKYIQSKENETL